MDVGERMELIGECPLIVTEVNSDSASSTVIFSFQLGTLTTSQRAIILNSGQDPTFVSDTMRTSIEHGGAIAGSQCSSALSVGTQLSHCRAVCTLKRLSSTIPLF